MGCQSGSECSLKFKTIVRKRMLKEITVRTLFHSHFIHLSFWFLPLNIPHLFIYFPTFCFIFPFQLICGSNTQGHQECVCHQHGKKRLLYLTLLPDTVCVDIVSQWQCTYVSLNNVMAISRCVLTDQKGSFAQCI